MTDESWLRGSHLASPTSTGGVDLAQIRAMLDRKPGNGSPDGAVLNSLVAAEPEWNARIRLRSPPARREQGHFVVVGMAAGVLRGAP
jgi:hypothetical protein